MTDSPIAVALIGPGRAGRARLRALEEHGDTQLAAVVPREPEADQPTLESLLADPSIDALMLCTPNLLHGQAAQAALEAGKHVAVEYPLASSNSEGGALFELARARQRVLHVAHIELLSPAQARLRELARPLGRPRGGSLHFRGSSEGWIGDASLAGSPALRALARLHRLVDLFGRARAEAARFETPRDAGYRLEVELRFGAGGGVLLIEERAPGLSRETSWDIRCERGSLLSPATAPPGGLFARDLDCFVSRIRSGARGYVSDERILHVLSLVDEIDRLL